MIYAFAGGLLFGSFANVVIYRLPRGLSINTPPSSCISCKKRLKAVDLIPIASWLSLRGRCRYCFATVSIRYPLVELACAMLFTSMVFYTPTLSAIPLAFLAFVLLCASMINIDKLEIPYGLILAGAVTGVVWVFVSHFNGQLFPLAPSLFDAFIGMAAGSLMMPITRNIRHGALTAMTGIFLGIQLMVIALVIGFFTIIVSRIIRGHLSQTIPYSNAATLLALWFGHFVLHIMGIG
jgi:leader peptidase (prepilin peptidase)/N-methyltransferase